MASAREVVLANLDAARGKVVENGDRRVVLALLDRARETIPKAERAAAEAAVDGNTLVPHDVARTVFLQGHVDGFYPTHDGDIDTCPAATCKWWSELGLAQQPGCIPGVT